MQQQSQQPDQGSNDKFYINTLCTQGHPEFTVEYTKFIIEFRRQAGIIPDHTADEALKILETDEPDTLLWQQLIQHWLQL